MNFFFGIQNDVVSSTLEIPIFQNQGIFFSDAVLYKLTILNSQWKIKIIDKLKKNSSFFHVSNSEINNSDIFFIGSEEDKKKLNSEKLVCFNNFTSHIPQGPTYRSNLRIQMDNFGFTSYQSDYPFNMIGAKGSVVTSLAAVTNKNADKNYIFFRNIFDLPTHNKFDIYIVDLKEKKIKTTFEAKTNFSNFFELQNQYLLPEMFIVSKNYLGIPIYISEKDGQLSMEHTNPPPSSILSSDRLLISKKFKKEISEIIN